MVGITDTALDLHYVCRKIWIMTLDQLEFSTYCIVNVDHDFGIYDSEDY